MIKDPTPWFIATLTICLIAGVCYGIGGGWYVALPYCVGFLDGAVVMLSAFVTLYIRGKRRAVTHG